MNSIEHPTSNKEFPTSNEIYFVIGHSVFDIGYSSLRLIAMGFARNPKKIKEVRSQNSVVRIQNKTEFEFKFNSVSWLLPPEFLVLIFRGYIKLSF
jgi:hypothetical protein